MSNEPLADDEVLYRRIPPGEGWFEPPDRMTSANFKLRKKDNGTKEEGLSVYRAAIVTSVEVLEKPDAITGSRVAWARVGDVRALCGGDGKALRLDVVAVHDEDDPGHAEIRGPEVGRLSGSASEALRRLFRLVGEGS